VRPGDVRLWPRINPGVSEADARRRRMDSRVSGPAVQPDHEPDRGHRDGQVGSWEESEATLRPLRRDAHSFEPAPPGPAAAFAGAPSAAPRPSATDSRRVSARGPPAPGRRSVRGGCFGWLDRQRPSCRRRHCGLEDGGVSGAGGVELADRLPVDLRPGGSGRARWRSSRSAATLVLANTAESAGVMVRRKPSGNPPCPRGRGHDEREGEVLVVGSQALTPSLYAAKRHAPRPRTRRCPPPRPGASRAFDELVDVELALANSSDSRPAPTRRKISICHILPRRARSPGPGRGRARRSVDVDEAVSSRRTVTLSSRPATWSVPCAVAASAGGSSR